MLPKTRILNSILIAALLVSILLIQMIDTSSATRYKRDTDITDTDTIFLGEGMSDYAGFAVSDAGDVNGDGIDDILIGAYGNDVISENAGKTYLVFGNSSGFQYDFSLSQADASFVGEGEGDWSGYAVAGGGDVNGDGFDDILIGARYNNQAGTQAGKTYLIFGKNTDWDQNMSLSYSDASYLGEFPEDFSGSSLSIAGDVNGDGFDDILIASPGNDHGGNMAGKTYLIYGKETGWIWDEYLHQADATFYGKANFDVSGSSVSISGDVNGDGFDDIIIGSGNGQEAYIMFGSTSGLMKDTNLSNADASLVGEPDSGRAGRSISTGGDVNNDGFDDILIGADLNSEGGPGFGQSYLVLGRDHGWSRGLSLSNSTASFIGEAQNDNSGAVVSIAGDVNGDGFDDILIGAFNNDEGGSSSGQAYLFFGKRTGWEMDISLSDADISFIGEDQGNSVGISLSGTADVNNDGFDDVLIGANRAGPGGSRTGCIYLAFIKSRPTPPGDFNVELSEDGSYLRLSWDPSYYIDNLSAYRVYRSENGMDYSLIASLGPDTLSYMDHDVILGRFYHYKVTAIGVPNMESFDSLGVSRMNDLDTDGDFAGNSVDDDDDGDGYPDANDAFPLNITEWLDYDGDSLGDQLDNDDDNDGLPDAIDPDPLSSMITVMKYMGAMNSTIEQINAEISRIRIDLDNFLNSVYGSLQTIRDNLDSYSVNISMDMDDMMLLVEEMEAGVLGNLSFQLLDLSEKVGENNTQLRNDLLDLKGSVDEFNKNMTNYISFLTTKVATGEDVENIKDNIDGVETELEKLDDLGEDISDLDRGQEDIEDRMSVLNIQVWVLMVLLIILLVVVVGIVIKVLFMKQDEPWNYEDDNEW